MIAVKRLGRTVQAPRHRAEPSKSTSEGPALIDNATADQVHRPVFGCPDGLRVVVAGQFRVGDEIRVQGLATADDDRHAVVEESLNADMFVARLSEAGTP